MAISANFKVSQHQCRGAVICCRYKIVFPLSMQIIVEESSLSGMSADFKGINWDHQRYVVQ